MPCHGENASPSSFTAILSVAVIGCSVAISSAIKSASLGSSHSIALV
jgi:hypothetical protein